MLEGLKEIDWDSRNATRVPIWLQELDSPKETKRIMAWENLESEVIKINDQDYDSGKRISNILNTDTPLLIVPFLIGLLKTGTNVNKSRIVGMLLSMMGYVEMRDEGDSYKSLAWQIYEEIWQGLDMYLKLIFDSDKYIRSGIVSLLCDFQTYSEVVLPHIRKAIREEQDEETKDWMQQRFKKQFPDEDIY